MSVDVFRSGAQARPQRGRSFDAFRNGDPGQPAARTHFNAFRNEGLSSVGSAGFTPDDPLDDA